MEIAAGKRNLENSRKVVDAVSKQYLRQKVPYRKEKKKKKKAILIKKPLR